MYQYQYQVFRKSLNPYSNGIYSISDKVFAAVGSANGS